MGMTIAEKILARSSGRKFVHPGQIIEARIDRLIAGEQFYRMNEAAIAAGIEKGIPSIWDIERFHLLLEHFQPAMNDLIFVARNRLGKLAQVHSTNLRLRLHFPFCPPFSGHLNCLPCSTPYVQRRTS